MVTKDLREAGLKVTHPRMKILELLSQSENRHVTAEDVYKALLDSGEDIGLATVYRVLTQFEGAGIVQRHYFEGNQSVFELAEGEHHDHMVCVKCGAISEFVDDTIEQRQEAVAKERGFEITDHSLILYGRCRDCRES